MLSTFCQRLVPSGAVMTEADADGLTGFYGLQSMLARSVVVAGEGFARFPLRRPEDGGGKLISLTD